ncbi:hypothetical protein SAMN05444422_102138 [Halobiforma haloterrestris]|uniref:Uncharacterized protein n=1 Tax=Natronobacterium haloterrestre TaxID=148448 RepID=A0A1I1E6X5_NATHA|nr:hypothetical protein [Halobiforma haloterrestris]SFB81038.1 hypothetical protein SAMN05444422_102138 [Halobiforma haloterrestris]
MKGPGILWMLQTAAGLSMAGPMFVIGLSHLYSGQYLSGTGFLLLGAIAVYLPTYFVNKIGGPRAWVRRRIGRKSGDGNGSDDDDADDEAGDEAGDGESDGYEPEQNSDETAPSAEDASTSTSTSTSTSAGIDRDPETGSASADGSSLLERVRRRR